LSEPTIWTSAGLPDRLPPGRYRFAGTFSAVGATHLTLGWEYGSYRFTRYRKAAGELPALVAPVGTDLEYVRLASEALSEARDLINTPANDLGPQELGEAVQRLALQHEAECRITVGEDLLRQNYPLIYEVGKGSAREPRLIDMRWGKRGAPRVTLVGKGVCFDTGGLDIKPSSGMILMKKDMGGAALTLALARMLMDADAPIQLRLLIPAGREQHLRPFVPAERRAAYAARTHGGDRQHRRGGQAGAGRRARRGRSRITRPAHRPRDSHRRGARGAGPGAAGYLLDAGGARRGTARHRRARVRSDVADAAVGRLRRRSRQPRRRSQQRLQHAIRGLDHRRAVPQTLRLAHAQLAARDVYAWNAKERPGRPVGADPHTVRALYRLVRQRFG
jgi:leucyl aminopeptidase